MSIWICGVVELMLQSACGQTIRSSSCLRRSVLAPVSTAAIRPVLHRRAYSRDSLSLGPGRPSLSPSSQQPHAEKTSPSSTFAQRNLSRAAAQCKFRPQYRYNFLDVEEVEESLYLVRTLKKNKHLIISSALANLVTEFLGPDLQDAKTVIFDCNPGPGVMTRSLINAGAKRVVALESNEQFLPNLQKLEGRLRGQLEVVHCDYFKLDPIGCGNMKRPAMFANKLFTDLGISEAGWADDITLKVLGILPIGNERGKLLKMAYALLERQSVFRYGRVELNLFMSEKEYQKITACPGDMLFYRAFGVLWQLSCEIELLHREPMESFMILPKRHGKQSSKDRLCLVRMRPRANLFSGGLTPSNASILMMMVKQCLAKRKVKLIDKLNLWSPDSGGELLSELSMPMDIMTGQVYPEEYLHLFQLMDKSQDFRQSWLYDEILENTARQGW